MAWTIAIILLVLLIWQTMATRRLAKKLNILNEYTQFLLFHPKVYADHRLKYGAFLKSIGDKDVVNQAMLSYRIIEDIAVQGADSFPLANTIKRANPEDM